MNQRLLIFLLFVTPFAFGQNFSITEELSFGGSSVDLLQVIPDGNGTGFFFYGSSNSDASIDHQSPNYGNQDVWIVRTDLDYNILWEESYGGNGNDLGQDAFIMNNHLYLVALSNSPVSGNKTVNTFGLNDVWLLKLTLDGAIVWQETYGGSENEISVDISNYQNQIAVYTISASSNSGNISTTNLGFTDCWVALLNTNDGTINDQAMYGSSSAEVFGGLHVIDDQLFIITNSFGSDGNIPELSAGFNEDIILFELNQDLDIIQTHGYYGDDMDFGRKLIKKSNNEYFLIAESQSGISGDKSDASFGSSDIWLLKLDANFDVVWDTVYGGTNYDLSTEYAHIDDNGSLVMISLSASPSGTGNKNALLHGFDDLWVLSVNTTTGEKIADHSFGGDSNESPTGMLPLGNGRLVLVGFTESNLSGNKGVPVKGPFDAWIIETDASDFLEIAEASKQETMFFYPNPTSNILTLSAVSNMGIRNVQFYAANGKLLLERKISSGEEMVQFDLTNAGPGVILYTLSSPTQSYHGRIIKR